MPSSLFDAFVISHQKEIKGKKDAQVYTMARVWTSDEHIELYEKNLKEERIEEEKKEKRKKGKEAKKNLKEAKESWKGLRTGGVKQKVLV